MKVLMRVDRANKSQSMNAANRALFEKFLNKKGYDWEKVVGCYQEAGQDKPQREQSYIVKFVTTAVYNTLVDMATLFEQDSILEISLPGNCYLLDNTGLVNCVKHIGQWTEVSEAEAKANGHYTETKDGYFIAR